MKGPESEFRMTGVRHIGGKRIAGIALAACLIGLPASAQWPQFRGPTGQGKAGDVSVPLKWKPDLHIRWKTEIEGLGHSSPVIEGNQIWLTTASTDGKTLGAIGLDRETGKTLRTVTMLTPSHVEEIHAKNSYASTTPVLDDGKLYAHFGTYGAAAIDTATGEVLWRNENLAIEHQGGPGSSPVLFRPAGLLIVTCDGADAQYVAALDIRSGREVWRRLRSAPFRENPITHRAFATPLLIEYQGQHQLISPGADQLHAYDPATGAELWHVRYTGFSTVPCPVFDGEAVLFCTGFFNPQLWAVRPDGKGDVTGTHILWKYETAAPETPSPILWEDQLLIVSDKGLGTALDRKTGRRLANFRLNGNFSASPIDVGEHLLFCSEEGRVRVVKPGPKPRIVESYEFPGRLMASPAVAGQELYFRTDQALYRVEEGPSVTGQPASTANKKREGD